MPRPSLSASVIIACCRTPNPILAVLLNAWSLSVSLSTAMQSIVLPMCTAVIENYENRPKIKYRRRTSSAPQRHPCRMRITRAKESAIDCSRLSCRSAFHDRPGHREVTPVFSAHPLRQLSCRLHIFATSWLDEHLPTHRTGDLVPVFLACVKLYRVSPQLACATISTRYIAGRVADVPKC